MIDVARCPQCGAVRPEHDEQCRDEDLQQHAQAAARLARTLNGTPWRERVRMSAREMADFAPAD